MENIREKLSRLRKRYRELASTRNVLENKVLQTKEVYRGCLATISHKRKSGPKVPYYYISCWKNNRRAVVYVSQQNLPRARKLIDNWQTYKKRIKRLKGIEEEINTILRKIADLQMVEELKSEEDKKRKKRQTRKKTKKST